MRGGWYALNACESESIEPRDETREALFMEAGAVWLGVNCGGGSKRKGVSGG